jgi:hypothetical protein
MRLLSMALALCTLCGNVRADGLVQLHFQPDCELAQLRSEAGEAPLKFAGLAAEDEASFAPARPTTTSARSPTRGLDDLRAAPRPGRGDRRAR